MPTLTLEEMNDLRSRVLAGQRLTLEQARDVIETQKGAQAVMAYEAANRPKKGGGKRAAAKRGMTDEALDNSLDDALEGI